MTMDTNMTGTTAAGGKRQITAFFDSYADAQAAQSRITAMGVSGADVELVDGSAGETGGAGQERGFMEKLGDFFMGDEDRQSYNEGLNRGGTLLTVMTTAENRDRIIDILDDEGTVDMDEREASWKSEGWTGQQTPAAAPGMAEAPASFDHTDRGGQSHGDTVEVVQEDLKIGKREVDHGRVRVRSYVVEDEISEDVTLRDEHVDVHRTPVDRPAGADAFHDETIEATEHDEEAVVSKEARVVEEISLDKTADERTETVHDTVRHTEVEVDDDRR